MRAESTSTSSLNTWRDDVSSTSTIVIFRRHTAHRPTRGSLFPLPRAMASKMNMTLDDIIAKGPGSKGKGGGNPGKMQTTRTRARPNPYGRPAPGGRTVSQQPVGSPRRGPPTGGTSVYVGNLAYTVSWQDLKDHFKSVGDVLHADVMTEPGSTRSKGCGIVTYANARDAATAIQSLHDTELKGRLIFVREDRESGAGGGPGVGGCLGRS